MWGQDERLRWLWENPIPSMFDSNAGPLEPELARVVTIYRVLGVAVFIVVILAVIVMARAGFGNASWIIPSLLGGVYVGGSSAIEIYVANRRYPTSSLVTVLNMIASVSPERRAEIKRFADSGVLTFSIAKRIARENHQFITEANRLNQAAFAGPQMSCETAPGEIITITTPSIKIPFTPCTDGWYRTHITDTILHRMLCSSAAGDDAGRYWIIDHSQGVWGVPASFVPKLQERVGALSSILSASESTLSR